MDNCINLYYNGKDDYFVCATDDEVHQLDEHFMKLEIKPMDSLKHRMTKFLKHHQGGRKKKRIIIDEEEEKKEEEKQENKDQDTGIDDFDIKVNELPDCRNGPTGPNDYIVSFGFEYENGSLFLLNTGPNGDLRNYLLSDGRYNQNVRVMNEQKTEDNHLLQITPDSALGERLVLNNLIYGRDKFKKMNFTKQFENCGYKLIFNSTGTSGLTGSDCKTIDINMSDIFRNGYIQGFDYLELIYTVFKMNKNIDLKCFIEYDDKIRNIIQTYIKENYEVCKGIYKSSIIDTQDEVCVNEKNKPIIDDINTLIKNEKETYKFFKPKTGNLPWMFCNERTVMECPDINNIEWSVQATVGVNYDNIISFMQQLFSYSKTKNKKNIEFDPYRYERFSLEKAIKLSEIISPESSEEIKNWLILKLFHLTIDRIQFINLRLYEGENQPLDKKYVQEGLKKGIDDLYKDWIKDKLQVKNEVVTKDIYINTGYTDIRTLYNNKYKINKDTTFFCIRHSLYQVLYELCDKNLETCIKYLNDVISNLKNKEIDLLPETLTYYIQDLTKGILYFELLKEKNVRPENNKKFQEYNDPDLSIEENYGKIEPHTKYRIKYYNFSTKNKEEDGKITLIGKTLLFEIRNYRSLKTAIEIEDDKKRRGQKRAREDEPIEPSAKKQTTTIPKKQTTTIPKKQTTTIPKKQTTTIPKKQTTTNTKKTPSTPGVPSWLKPK